MRSRRGPGGRFLWCLWDPPGLVIASFAWLLVLSLLVAVLVSISQWVGLLSPIGITEAIWFIGLFGMCLWSHLVVLTSNPGVVPLRSNGMVLSGMAGEEGAMDEHEMEEVEEEMPLHEYEACEDDGSLLIYCDECEIYRPSSLWVNNCIGIGNQKAFLLLLLYVTATSFQAAVLVLLQYATCSHGTFACGLRENQFPGKLGGWILAAAAVFGLFCSLMLAMEMLNMYQDPLLLLIANQLAARRGGDKSKSTLERYLSVICGTDGIKVSWFSPVPERRSLCEAEIVQGYRCRTEDAASCWV
ncbi:hypothetical protein PsorP6_005650 [Peronosclerospora sorghi]|uniref:Uncharacterized protein n=1 Tax=Peronosclerospora sorghi TaxID=230839 RepID=A0ACC0W608_9STRA|nr:hypothetical protein PsorP6_005650 [Peronosclerospora sorghi]